MNQNKYYTFRQGHAPSCAITQQQNQLRADMKCIVFTPLNTNIHFFVQIY